MALYLTNSNFISDDQTTTNLNCTSQSTLQSLNTNGTLQINSTLGVADNIIVKTGASTQAWNNLAAAGIEIGTPNQFLITDPTLLVPVWKSGTTYYNIAYLNDITSINFNVAATTIITFGTVTFFTQKFGTTNFVGLEYIPATGTDPYFFRCINAGIYKLNFNIVLVKGSAGSAQVAIYAVVTTTSGTTNSPRLYSTVLGSTVTGNAIIAGCIYLTLDVNDTFVINTVRIGANAGALNRLLNVASITISCVNQVSNS